MCWIALVCNFSNSNFSSLVISTFAFSTASSWVLSIARYSFLSPSGTVLPGALYVPAFTKIVILILKSWKLSTVPLTAGFWLCAHWRQLSFGQVTICHSQDLKMGWKWHTDKAMIIVFLSFFLHHICQDPFNDKMIRLHASADYSSSKVCLECV